MAGKMIIRYFGAEDVQVLDDLTMAAVERVVRYRLTHEGKSMFISTVSQEVTGNVRGTLVIPPNAHVLFAYTDPSGSNLDATVAMLKQHVAWHGGIEFDENDLPVEPSH